MKKIALLHFATFSILYASQPSDIIKDMQIFKEKQLQNIAAIHKENSEIVKQNRIYYIKVAKAATEYYKKYISKKWGDTKLSNISTFVQYNDDMNARQSVDFKKGVVTLEVISDTNNSVNTDYFEKERDKLSHETLSQATTKDPVASLESKFMKKKSITSHYQKHDNSKFLDGYLENKKIKQGDIKQKKVTLKDGDVKFIYFVDVKMVPEHLKKRALKFKPFVLEKSREYGIEPSSIFATIETESYFNPLARSNIPAYGLMQIVPTTAGIDAYYALTKKKKLLPPAYLYNAHNNIELGAKYMQIIRYNYLKGIRNPLSRLYCSATAYNAGIGSLFRVFANSKFAKEDAIKKINSMTPDEVYARLRTSKRLTLEAREYVKHIKTRSENYKIWDKEIEGHL